MTVKSRKRWRNKPEALANLCFRYGQRVLEYLNASSSSQNHNLKIRLIRYYIELGSNWSRKREKIDWKDHDLASLKFETYGLITRVLSITEGDRNSDLYLEIRQVSAAKNIGEYGFAFELSESALSSALKREEYGLAVHILDLQVEIIDNWRNFPQKEHTIVKIIRLREEIDDKAREISFFTRLRSTIIDPIKAEWVETGRPPVEKLESLRVMLASLESKSPNSTLARTDYHAFFVLVFLLGGEFEKALNSMIELIAIYESSSQVKVKFPGRYILHLRSFITLLIQQGKQNEAWAQLLVLDRLGEELQERKSEIKIAWMISAFLFSHQFREKEVFERAKATFDTIFPARRLMHEDLSIEFVKSSWWIFINHVEFEEWAFALRIGQSLLTNKSKLDAHVLLNIRVAMFACEVALYFDDEDRIETSYRAAYQFVARKDDTYSYGFALLKAFKEAWSKRKTSLPNLVSEGVFEYRPTALNFQHLYDVIIRHLKGHPQ